MTDYRRLSHTRWECKYHVVFIPKGRRKRLYQHLRVHLGEVLRALARQRESEVAEGRLHQDHVHLLLSIPPTYAVSQVVGFLKGKSAIHIARTYGGRTRNFVGEHFWARGYFVLFSVYLLSPCMACFLAPLQLGLFPLRQLDL